MTATVPSTKTVPGVDGHWEMTDPDSFHLKEQWMLDGQMAAYGLVNADAYLTSRHAYTAAGVEVPYLATTGRALTEQ